MLKETRIENARRDLFEVGRYLGAAMYNLDKAKRKMFEYSADKEKVEFWELISKFWEGEIARWEKLAADIEAAAIIDLETD